MGVNYSQTSLNGSPVPIYFTVQNITLLMITGIKCPSIVFLYKYFDGMGVFNLVTCRTWNLRD